MGCYPFRRSRHTVVARNDSEIHASEVIDVHQRVVALTGHVLLGILCVIDPFVPHGDRSGGHLLGPGPFLPDLNLALVEGLLLELNKFGGHGVYSRRHLAVHRLISQICAHLETTWGEGSAPKILVSLRAAVLAL